ncbi:helix-turn-helix domain-containing protein [Streptomyces sp. NBC_01304]|uniref:helix-turn-helix domain-containing protein n=1 Tax=Streptomyces sp. NBC_01304 TaxID=2903818 RepID=UPI002E112104|nr:helix-turn-helix domain-containing protein [Streptomyces sp. NBC_01304]
MSSSTTEPEPSDGLKAFGAVLKSFRKHASYTQESLASEIGYSTHFLASVEQGRRLPPQRFVDQCEASLDAFGTLRVAANQLARQPGIASWFRHWAHLEQDAVSLYTFESRLVPGLLQTEAYARTLFEEREPPLTDEQIEHQLTARAERQQLLLDRPNSTYSFIVEEHVVTRPTGGAAVMREVIDRMLERTSPRNVKLQIMPQSRGVHPGLDGPIQLLETPDNRWYGYLEGQENGQFVSDPKVISTLHRRYAKLRTQALTPEDSVGLLERLRGAL